MRETYWGQYYHALFIKASDTDFVSVSAARTFTATDTTDKCIDITTSEDSIFEANEMFTVSLSVLSPTTGVTIQRNQTTVIIVDDDGIIVVLHVVLMSVLRDCE